MVSYTLKGAGFEVLEAEDGVKALGVLANTRVDLIITDINMPNMDGVTLVKRVRAGGTHASTPILILTTESGDDMKKAGKEAGATGWLVKPFDSMKLLEVIRMVIR